MTRWIAIPALLLGLSLSALATESDWAFRYSRAVQRHDRAMRKVERAQDRAMLRADLAYARAMRRAELRAYRHARVYVVRPRQRLY